MSESMASTVKGSFALVIGNTTSLAINAIGAILVARMLETSEYGLFTLSLILPGFFTLFTSWGINPALIRYIARKQKENDSFNKKSLIRAAYIFNFITSSLLSLILYISADILATSILRRPEIGAYVRITSLLILSQTIFQTDVSVLAGYEKMTHRASVNILQSLIKGILGPVLVFLGFGVVGVVTAHTLSYIIAAIAGFLLVVKHTQNVQELKMRTPLVEAITLMIGYGGPLFLSKIFVGMSTQFRGILLSWYITDDVIGNFGVANWFNILVRAITLSIGVALFPTFSRYDINHEPERIKEIYKGSIRYSTIFIIPIICLIITTSNSLIYFLFSTKYSEAPFLLSMLLVPSLLIGLGSVSIVRLLNSQGETRASFIIQAFGALLTIIFSYIFIQYWGIFGLLTGIILSALSQTLLGNYVIRNKYDLKVDFMHASKTILASIIAGGLTFSLRIFTSMPNTFIDLVFTTIVFLSAYLVTAPLIGVIEQQDIYNLNSILKNIPRIYPITRILLNIEESIIRLRSQALDN